MLEALHVSKKYPGGVLANDDVSLAVPLGQVHAVVGENGAGKSTLVKMLYGLESPDAGEIRLNGAACRWSTPREAIGAGVGLVPQHLQLVASMSAAENVVLGSEPARGPWLDRRAACERVDELARRHGLPIDPRARVGDLAAGVQQRVAILKALHRGARVLLLDEPTALLAPHEAKALFDSLAAFVESGLGVLLVTHKLSEVRLVAHTFTVLRGGRVVAHGLPSETSDAQLAHWIAGREVSPVRRQRARPAPMVPLVQVRGLTAARSSGSLELADVSLDVGAGEIVGIAGVEGNGQDRLCELLSGLQAPSLGEGAIRGAVFTGLGARYARRLGIACVPQDRLARGIAPSLSIAENAASVDYSEMPASRRGVLNRAALRERAQCLIERYGVLGGEPDTPIGALSGGNMQKVVLGRELLAAPRFLIAAHPTRGVDIGAAQTLHQALVSLRDAGAGVLLVSADLDEILALSDRIVVLFEGRLVAHLAGDHATPEALGLYMTGMAHDPRANATLPPSFTRGVSP